MFLIILIFLDPCPSAPKWNYNITQLAEDTSGAILLQFMPLLPNKWKLYKKHEMSKWFCRWDDIESDYKEIQFCFEFVFLKTKTDIFIFLKQ